MVESFLAYLQSEENRSPQTLVTYRVALEEMEAYLRDCDESLSWTTLDQDVARDWMVELMEKGNAPRTVCKKLSALKTFYRYLLRCGLVKSDPVRLLQGPKQDKPLPQFVRESEMDELLDGNYFADDLAGQRDRLVLLILYSTGIRLAELHGLNWADIDLQGQQMRVTGKRRKQRIVPFGNELRDALLDYRQRLSVEKPNRSEPEAVLVNLKRGGRMSRGQIYQTVHHYLSMVTTLKKRSPHVLRHSFATAMLNNEANLQSVKELLGHENLATTEVYTHTTFEELKRMYNQAHPRAK